MAGQAYGMVFTIDGDELQFQNVGVDIGGSNIDTSSSLNPDGSKNEGFSDTTGDLSTLTIDVNSIIKDSRVLTWMATLQPKFQYTLTYVINYAGYTITGENIFVDSMNLDFGIPGGARVRARFMSIQPGFTIA